MDPDIDVRVENTVMTAFVGNDTHRTEPFVDFFYPIIHFGVQQEGQNSSTNEVVGVVSATLYWRDILRKSSLDPHDGLHVVISNTCNQTFTYTWSATEIVYAGAGDLHDMNYEEVGIEFPLPVSGIDPEHGDDCRYTMHAYPSAAMLKSFKTEQPE